MSTGQKGVRLRSSRSETNGQVPHICRIGGASLPKAATEEIQNLDGGGMADPI